tara:strand:+ start:154 stop:945 length:792 start_codon:yes stop_codon:yes gene_type:complete
MSEENTLLVETIGKVMKITLNRPDRMNALTTGMFDELRGILEDLDTEQTRALVITGAGRAFCAGADISGRGFGPGKPGDASRASLEDHYNPGMLALASADIPVITAVNGAAAGIGATLALSGDLIVAGKSAYFLQAFVNIGLVPDGGGTWVLPKAMGLPRAMEAMLLGERLPAEDALAMGAINRCVDDDKVVEEAMALAERLANGPTLAIGQIRKLARNAQGSSMADAMKAEAEAQQIAGNSQDFMIGAQAFAAKTKAQFTGK